MTLPKIKYQVFQLLCVASLLAGCSPGSGGSSSSSSTEETLSNKTCAAATYTITSPANSAGLTQNCVASLPLSKASNTAIVASVTNGGSYSLICQNNSRWSSTPSVSSCPAPAIITPPGSTTSGTTTTGGSTTSGTTTTTTGGSTSGTTTTGGTTSGTTTTGGTTGGGTTTTGGSTTTTTTTTKSRGIRLDPGYFYNSYPGKTPSQIATDVVTNLKNAKANTIYLYAYNTVYGAYYPTTYSQTSVESGLGSQNIFGAVLSEAHNQGLKVVAVVPLNNFMLPWQNNSSWRVKQANGVDYQPAGTYLLSASSAAYKSWYTGFINDLITHNPTVDQVEAVEPTLDYSWSGVPDQNPSAITAFNTQYPGSAVGSANWLTFRASEFTNLVALFNQTVHAKGKESCLVQTWTINSSGTLVSAATLKTSTGFDWIAIATLTGTSKMDHLISEFIWQQWFSEYATSVFNPEWISTIGVSYTNTLRAAGSTSDLIVHAEISTFSGSKNTTTPTLDEFARNMTATSKLTNGVSVYDYNQIKTRSAFTQLSNWAP